MSDTVETHDTDETGYHNSAESLITFQNGKDVYGGNYVYVRKNSPGYGGELIVTDIEVVDDVPMSRTVTYYQESYYYPDYPTMTFTEMGETVGDDPRGHTAVLFAVA